MNHRTHRFKMPYQNTKLEASALVERALDGGDYDRGAIETAAAQAENVTKALGRLVQTLNDGKALTDGEVYYVALGYEKDDEL